LPALATEDKKTKKKSSSVNKATEDEDENLNS